MITTANRIFVNPEYADLFEENFRNRAGLVDRMPGFVSNQLLRPVNPGDPYIVLTVWESRAHFENWVRSDEFRLGMPVRAVFRRRRSALPVNLSYTKLFSTPVVPI